MMIAGKPKAMIRAASRIMLLLGLTLPPRAGPSMSFPLSAVAAREIEFSSRFCSNIRYSPDLTSCWRPICVSIRSCSGDSPTWPWYFPYCEATELRWISRLRRACFKARRIARSMSSICVVKGITEGEFSLALCNSRLRLCTSWL